MQAVPVERALHLKSACTTLPDGTVVGWGPVVDDKEAFPRYEDVLEEPGAHVVLLADDHLLVGGPYPADGGVVQARGLHGDRGRRVGVRGARGVRHLPVGADPRMSPGHVLDDVAWSPSPVRRPTSP